jgi:hypothetical protein
VWSIVEVNLGIICGCAMRLKSLIMTYLPQLGLFSSHPSGNATYESWGRGLRTDEGKAQRAYQLHSVQKGSAEPGSANRNVDDFRRYKTNTEGKSGDGGSTDEILG